ncbi:hypothetical protein [Polaromonas sp. YR568]|uniref:hypothetical protein n=1 Tax=Polaromonas sp. YR568 TaxID=1855301 RepID=UPI00398BF785
MQRFDLPAMRRAKNRRKVLPQTGSNPLEQRFKLRHAVREGMARMEHTNTSGHG